MGADSRAGLEWARVTRGRVVRSRQRAGQLATCLLFALGLLSALPERALSAVHEVPSLGEWGLLLLSLLLLTGGWFAVRRTHQTPPEQNRDTGGS